MFRWILAALVAFGIAPAHAAGPTPGKLCLDAARAAERINRLPTGVLRAIGVVESGRSVDAGGAAPWPWTLDVEGRGAFFPDRQAALTGLEAALASGPASVDVGCFQVNLLNHPDAFASLTDALDPVANANYAARFLASLHAPGRPWSDAVARYHSAVLARGAPYGAAVLSAWLGASPDRTASASDDPHIIRIAVAFRVLPSKWRARSSELPSIIGPQ